jgi:hypothetical protein
MKPRHVGRIDDVLGVLRRFDDTLRFAWKLGAGTVGRPEMETLRVRPACGCSCRLRFGETEAMIGDTNREGELG